MSMVMLQGVLRMPPELWSNEPVDVSQRHQRYVEAADKLADIEKLVEGSDEMDADLVSKIRQVLDS